MHVAPLFDVDYMRNLKRCMPPIVQIGDYNKEFDCAYSDYAQTLRGRQTIWWHMDIGGSLFVNADLDRGTGHRGIAYEDGQVCESTNPMLTILSRNKQKIAVKAVA